MAIDVANLSDSELRQLISNHDAKGATSAPRCVEAQAELDRRGNKGLDVKTTVTALTQAATQGRFVSYKEVADANGANWKKVHYPMAKHLDEVLAYCHRNKLPYLTAIVVPKPNVKTGKQNTETLRGFIACIERLGVSITGEDDFMYAEQQRVFDWGRSQSRSNMG